MNNNSLNGMLGLGKLPTHSYEFGGKAFTTQELWMKISEKMNVIIEHFNYLDKQFTNQDENVNQKLDYLLGEGLTEQVSKELLIKIENGTFDDLINGSLLSDINKKVDDTREELNNSLYSTKKEIESSLETAIDNVNKKVDESIKGVDDKLLASDIKVMNVIQQNFFNKIKSSSSKLLGHRGVNAIYPENTLIAIQNGCELGYFGLEFDILPTKDGEFVLMHDDTVDRTTTGSGYVSNLTLAEIKQFSIDGGSNIQYYPDLKVPTLEEVLNIFQRYDTYACIEIKPSSIFNYEKFLVLINKYKLQERVVIISFSLDMLKKIRELDKNIIIAYNGNMSIETINDCVKLGNSLISTPNAYITETLIKYAHDNNIGVISYSASSITQFHNFLNMGVDLMTTDNLIQGGGY